MRSILILLRVICNILRAILDYSSTAVAVCDMRPPAHFFETIIAACDSRLFLRAVRAWGRGVYYLVLNYTTPSL